MPLGQKSGQKYLIVFIQYTNANRHRPTGHFVIDRNWPNHPLINNSVDLIWNWINVYCHTVRKVALIRQNVVLFYWFPFSFPHWKSFLMIVQWSICCREWPMTASITSSIQKIPIWGKQRGDDSHLDHFPSRFFVLLLRKQPNIPWHSPRSDSVSSLFFPLWQWLQSSIAKNQTPKCETRK